MGKKKRKHRGPSADELVLLRTHHEQEWAYTQRLAHQSFRSMATLSSLPTEQGGLGRAISAQTLSQLVQGYHARMADIQQETLEQHLERELHDLDNTQRAIATQLAKDEANGVRLDAALLREYRATGESRRKLLGTDAMGPAEPEARDDIAVLDELNRALVALGEKPLKPLEPLER